MKPKSIAFAGLVFAGLSTPVMADAIEGMFKRPNGILVKIHNCGNSFCVTAASGAHKGGSAGKLQTASTGKYTGSLTDLENGKTYSGKASLNGDTLTVSGCVLGGLLCQSEAWERQ